MVGFTKIKLRYNTLGNFHIRTSIKKALIQNIPVFRGNLLDIGCGKMPYRKLILENDKIKQYHGVDLDGHFTYDKNIKPDFFWDGYQLPISDAKYDIALLIEVLEHCPEPTIVIKEASRILQPGGILFFTVPNIWPLHEAPYDMYRYTPFSLEKLLKENGFSKVEIKAGGGWNASLGQMLGLYLQRSKMNKYIRFVLCWLFLPIIYLLYRLDKAPKQFDNNQMIPSFQGIAYK